MADVKREKRPTSAVAGSSAARSAPPPPPAVVRRAGAQAKPTITYWNGLTGADGKVMDGLIEQFSNETGIKMEQQRILWPDLYAKLQVSVPAGEGPDLCLIHTVEVPHFASDGILDADGPGPARRRRASRRRTTWRRRGREASTRGSATRCRSTCPSTSST